MKRNIKLGIVCLFAVSFILVLAGCSLFGGGNNLDPGTIAVTNINIEEGQVRMSPPVDYIPSYRPDYSKYTIQLTILPENATNKNYTIALENSSDSQYLQVAANGELTAKAVKGTMDNDNVFTAEPIYVKIQSVSNPSVSQRVTVYIEEVAITDFQFNPSKKDFIIGDSPWRLVPNFVPRHALIGMENVRFTSTNESFATVDNLTGLITPSNVNVGSTTIVVTTTAAGATVSKTFDVSVKYEAPNWTLNSSGASFFKQMVGHLEDIQFNISTSQTRADNNPDIEWRVDGQRILGEKTFSYTYTPEDIMRGTHNVSVYIEDSLGQSQLITSPGIEIYEVLQESNVTLTESFLTPTFVKDNVNVKVAIENNYYPPESINWYLYDEDAETLYDLDAFSSPDEDYEINFQIPKAGNFTIQASCVIYPNSTAPTMYVNKRTTTVINVEARPEGNNIQNVYIKGINHGTLASPLYLPFVVWDIPAYENDITVEINNDGAITRISKSDPLYEEYFYVNGFAVPDDIAQLTDSFKARVKGTVYNYTDEVEYNADDIAPAEYEFLNIIDDTLNITSYIANMKELAKVINYLHIFRPANLFVNGSNPGYKVNIYMPFTYSEIDQEAYPANERPDLSPENENLFRLISGANKAYGESGSYSFNFLVKSDNSVDLTFTFPAQQDLIVDTTHSKEKYPTIRYYTDNPRPSYYNSFATEIGQSISVTTSNQLYLAVSWGLKPVPVNGSPADLVYTEAKNVLRRIIDDSMSDADKVQAIYNYLSTEIYYDSQLLSLSMLPNALQPANLHFYEGFYLEGVFLRGSAVCDGIAKAFNLLAYMEGIEALKISGEAMNSSNQLIGHAWNMVLLDGKWYAVDATWASIQDGNKELPTYRYLLVTDEKLQSSHFALGTYPPTELENLNFDQYYNKPVDTTPAFDHYINSSAEFENMFSYYVTLINSNPDLDVLYVEIKFDFALTQSSIETFLAGVNVGASFNWMALYDHNIVYIIIQG